ncbi:hypothetical protein BCR39DRAFT_547996 [Naematelia encephala]|uniref:Thioester reductase (TE) domain-containing protein n=1 Tax=Naematelia encephala TaxID=71784 RepID=A0A1Y2AND9_9TREE|nr:hypothetical protein BCR39DRAFT_547996 [Naematelia encephala]
MPTVLITGLNGFVAVHTALKFLSNGWSVRGTVRSQAKADKVKQLPSLLPYIQQGKVEVVIVADLVEGDFSQALDGVDAVAHVASPINLADGTWADYRDPAVKGTVRLLEQAAKVPSVKAVAQMSSWAAAADISVPFTEQIGKVYTENDWFPLTDEDAEKLVDNHDGVTQALWYCTSKKLAELAAHETRKRTGAAYSVGSVLAPMIFGPALHYGPKATGEELNKADASTSWLYQSVAGGRDGTLPPSSFPSWTSVESVAEALYKIIEKRSNERYLIYEGPFDYQQFANIARKLYPELDKAGVIPLGNPEDCPSEKGTYTLDTTKAERELGIKFDHTKEEMIKQVVDQIVALGAASA